MTNKEYADRVYETITTLGTTPEQCADNLKCMGLTAKYIYTNQWLLFYFVQCMGFKDVMEVATNALVFRAPGTYRTRQPWSKLERPHTNELIKGVWDAFS